MPKGELIDFRVLPKDTKRLQSIVSDLQQRGMSASINHPTAFCGGCDWSYGEDWSKMMDSVEIWNGGWDVQDELALQKWDVLLQQNKRITAIGSSDSHTPPILKSSYTTNLPIGLPTTHIGAKRLTEKDLFDAIKRRRVFITEKPEMNLQVQSPKSEVQSQAFELGDEIRLNNLEQPRFRLLAENFPVGAKVLIIANGEKVREEKIENANFDKEIELSLNRSGYVRIEIRDVNNKMLGLTNPIFIVREGEKNAEIQNEKYLNYAEIIADLNFIDRNILHIQD